MVESDALRVSLCTRSQPGTLNGGWWPETTDPERELPLIVPVLARLGRGPAQWLRASFEDWTSHPHTIVAADGRVVSVGWNRVVLRHLLMARCGSAAMAFVLVVPPDTEPVVARRALARAADRHVQHVRAAAEILRLANHDVPVA